MDAVSLEVVPSPKSHFHAVTFPIDWSVNATKAAVHIEQVVRPFGLQRLHELRLERHEPEAPELRRP